jgi:hypothetical protein
MLGFLKKWSGIMKLRNFKLRRILLPALGTFSGLFLVLAVALFFRIIFDAAYFSTSRVIDKALAASFGTFFQGLVGTTAAIAGSLFSLHKIDKPKSLNWKTSITK